MNNQLKTVDMNVKELVPYAGNAKEHPEWHVDQIVESIKEFGFNDPIGAWHNPEGEPVIVEGHGRLLAAKKLGIEKVPVVFLDHMDDEARRAYTIVHNQTTMNTGFNEAVLNAELSSLKNFNMEDFGFAPGENLEDFDHVFEDDAPENPPTRCKENEIWQLGEHRLICGDSTNVETLKSLMDGKRANLLLTDPPYGVNYATKAGEVYNDNLESAEFTKFLLNAFNAAYETTEDQCPFYIWYASTKTEFFKALEQTGWELHQILEWVKNTITLGRSDYQFQNEPCLYGWKRNKSHYFAPTRKERTIFDDVTPYDKMTKAQLLEMVLSLTDGIETNILRYDKPFKNESHPTMKPVALFAHLIRNSSQKGDIVLDPFAGSGTTLAACEQMERKAYLVEYDPHYCDVIIERYENLSGNTAEKVA